MRVLAIGCHPDDIEIGCGGTLAKYAKLGHEVFSCHVANGNMGHAIIMPDELRRIRTKEAEEAGAVLGVKEVFNIDVNEKSALMNQNIFPSVNHHRRFPPSFTITFERRLSFRES
jgi:LmbE family N-acetylglucosaminyl deacetylase